MNNYDYRWHPCDHCKQLGKTVQILDAQSYAVGDANNWSEAERICDRHNAVVVALSLQTVSDFAATVEGKDE